MNKNLEKILDKIILGLEQGTVPWQKPWVGDGLPSNILTKKPYRGLNSIYLNFISLEKGYNSQYWATFKQIQNLGGSVRHKQKSTEVVYWNWVEKELNTKDKNGEKEKKKIPFIKSYRVFNLEQITGIEIETVGNQEKLVFNPIEKAEEIIKRNNPVIVFQQQRAFYSPSKDIINLPKKESFKSIEEYYSTLYHEIGHWSGGKNRLNRSGITDCNSFGSEAYSLEELIAELSSNFLCNHVGIEATFDNSVAYIDGWLKVLKKDKKMLLKAASQAQKVYDYLLGED